jgi:2-polyprenyl-6-hydroxyphenyl methylase/3-demethylubiquinone-9 3-methyltransferase
MHALYSGVRNGATRKTGRTHVMSGTSVDADEVAKFEAMAAEWWDERGTAAPLHRMNPCRLDYIARQIAAEFDRDPAARAPLAGLRLADIGCGGGLLSEPMARLGADVVGADAGTENIGAARTHSAAAGLEIDYRATTAEALAAGGETFDVLLAMEIVEHVPDPRSFVATCAGLLRPGGLMICSTLNRTAKAWALAVFGAERVMRWLPPGTHDWSRFLTPDELADMLTAAGLHVVDRKGMVFDPLSGAWTLSERDLSVNYVVAAAKPR